MDLEPKPLSLELYRRAKELKATHVSLNFSGGCDEGYLNVSVLCGDDPAHLKHTGMTSTELIKKYYSTAPVDCENFPHYSYAQKIASARTALESDIEEWAWQEYSYSGAGDGHDYGDDIEYNLETLMMTSSNWWMERTEGETGEMPMTIDCRSLEAASENSVESQGNV